MSAQSLLRKKQYAGPGKLTARQALWSYHTGPSWMDAALDTLEVGGGETVLDVGCGPGRWLAELRQRGHTGRLLGLDASPGMAAAAAGQSGAATVVADAVALPVPDAGVDVALAMHMLYHVPDLPAAVRELRRVLRRGGVLLAATNGSRHIAEIRAVMDEAASRVLGEPRHFTSSFTLENGAEVLGACFDRVERQDHPATVFVPTAGPVQAYIASFGPELAGLPDPDAWDEFLVAAGELVGARVERYGRFAVSAHPGYFVCS